MEDIKNQSVETGKFGGCEKILYSGTLLIFANFLPNLSVLSLDRWKFFHTKLGEVFVSCKPASEATYVCSINRSENECDTLLDSSFTRRVNKTDQQMILEYLEAHTVDINFRMLCNNSLAFPAITTDHKFLLLRFIKNLQFKSFSKYLSQHNLLQQYC